MAAGSKPILSVRGVVKEFPGVRALSGVDLDLYGGEVHALVGENGAGKSTLMKVLAGVHAPDAGQVLLDGEPVRISDPHHSLELGITTIHQELALVGCLTVAENICLGREPRRGLVVDREAMRARAVAALGRLGAQLDPDGKVSGLGVARQQLVEIARALTRNTRVLIMDEPTAALSVAESEALFAVMNELKAGGVALVFISHRLDDLYRVSERVTVLRDGQSVSTGMLAGLTPDALIAAMVGRTVQDLYPPRPDAPARTAEVLRVENLSRSGAFSDITFSIRAGEIVGLAGLVGAGRTELTRAIAGAEPADGGRVFVDGRELVARTPSDSIAAGVACLPEDRKLEGLVLPMSVQENVALSRTASAGTFVPLDRAGMAEEARRYKADLSIRTPDVVTRVVTLSGGNQQKVLLARCMTMNPRVIIFDEPTRGIDVGARAEIYAQIQGLAQQGKAVLIVSSDLPEVLGMSDTVLVMCAGRLTGRFDRASATSEKVLAAALPAGSAGGVTAPGQEAKA